MRIKHRALVIKLISLLVGAILLFVLFFDRYTYDDYRVGACDTKSTGLVANLVGSFRSGQPTKRSSPYYLRIEIVGGNSGRVIVGGLGLTSMASKKKIDLREIKMVEVKDSRGSISNVIYLADSLWLKYDDYMLTGVVTERVASEDKISYFACRFNKSHWSEWRIPLWDAFMSV